MPRKIKSIAELPSWFDLSRYQWIREVKRRVFFDELVMRTWYLEFEESELSKWEDIYQLIAQNGRWTGEVSEDQQLPIHKHLDAEKKRRLTPYADLTLSHEEAVWPLTVRSAQKEFIESDIKIPDQGNQYTDPMSFVSWDAYSHKERSHKRKHPSIVHTTIGLHFSDDVILGELKRLLPIWRKALSKTTGNSLDSPKDRPSTLSRVIEYRILQLLDLWVWERRYKTKIPNKILTVALYPDGMKGESDLVKTVIPLARWACTRDGRLALQSLAALADGENLRK